MKLISAASFFVTVAATAIAAEPVYDAEHVKAACLVEWGSEYEMVAFCINERNAGYDKYIRILASADPALAKTFARCQSEWQQEWEMVAYCASEEVNSYRHLATMLGDLPANIAKEIKAGCTREWGVEFTMVVYCANERANGWRSINR